MKLRKSGARIAVPQYSIIACIKATLPFTVQQITLRLSKQVGGTWGRELSMELMTNAHRI